MQVAQSIQIDVKSRGMQPRISAKQGDVNSRVVQISLYAGGVAWTPDGAGLKGMVQYRKPDGTGGAYDVMPDNATKAVTISGNQLTVNLAPQVLTAPGLVLCQVQLLTGSTVLTTFCWLIDVEEDVLSGAVSEDYYNVATLDGLSNRITNLATQLAAAQADITAAQQAAQTAQDAATAAQTKANAALPKSGGAMTGNLDMGAHDIRFQDAVLRADPYHYPEGDGYRVMVHNPLTNGQGEMMVATPTDAESAANKGYVDEQVAGRVKTVNGRGPDAKGNVDIEVSGGGVKTINNKAPDASGNVALTATDVGALSNRGGTVSGNLTVGAVTAMSISAETEINFADRGHGRVALINASDTDGPAIRIIFPDNQNGPVRVIGVATPTDDDNAANKQYVDALTAKLLPLTGGKMQGNLNMAGFDLLLDADKSTWLRAEKGDVYIGSNGVDAVRISRDMISLLRDQILELGILKFGGEDTGYYLSSEGSGPSSAGQPAHPIAALYGNNGDEPVELRYLADPTTPLSAANKQYVDQQLEPIETIEVTEAGVAAIERTQEPDGTPYRFKRLYITAYLPKPEASYQPRIWCMQDDIYLSGAGSTPGNIGTANNMYATQICGIEHGLWMTYGVAPQQGAAWSGAINTSIGYEPVLASKYPYCNRVKIAKSTGAAWEIGTIIKIYGVRA